MSLRVKGEHAVITRDQNGGINVYKHEVAGLRSLPGDGNQAESTGHGARTARGKGDALAGDC